MAASIKATKEVIYSWEGKDKKGKAVKGEMKASGDSFVSATPVSYTHLDVYKRQIVNISVKKIRKNHGF